MELLTAVQVLNTLVGAATNSMLAAQKFAGLVSMASAEGRDISDEELAALKAESDDKTAVLLDLLFTNPPASPQG